MIWSIVLLAFTTVQRLGELVLARRNTQALIAQGAHEVAPGHYPLMVIMHGAWLIGLWALGWNRPLHWPWVAVFLALQVLRVWVIASLGGRWTTRIIILPGAPLVARGPYRFIPHPNYTVVIGEILVLPLAFGLPVYGLVFTVLNLGVLWIRVRAENAALKPLRG